MGKSGLIARKIAATFSSTGTPALYLHPVEALHGDLGMVVRGDVVLALSASGDGGNPRIAGDHQAAASAADCDDRDESLRSLRARRPPHAPQLWRRRDVRLIVRSRRRLAR